MRKLIRTVGRILGNVADNSITFRLLTGLGTIGLTILFSFILGINVSPMLILVAIPSLILAIAATFLICCLLSCIASWIDRHI